MQQQLSLTEEEQKANKMEDLTEGKPDYHKTTFFNKVRRIDENYNTGDKRVTKLFIKSDKFLELQRSLFWFFLSSSLIYYILAVILGDYSMSNFAIIHWLIGSCVTIHIEGVLKTIYKIRDKI